MQLSDHSHRGHLLKSSSASVGMEPFQHKQEMGDAVPTVDYYHGSRHSPLGPLPMETANSRWITTAEALKQNLASTILFLRRKLRPRDQETQLR